MKGNTTSWVNKEDRASHVCVTPAVVSKHLTERGKDDNDHLTTHLLGMGGVQSLRLNGTRPLWQGYSPPTQPQ